ncbi:transcriptional regulator, ArsR family [Methanosalsum zhilinae DSM 4017]|uniref:Transcriptional regulator, ArsR family n=1 Tax=Methanosalsum zhilinae (strain DSM 4017 / NBRC 107636 / OCM 62 / WeN5) TaxID=679901 RepID=F7XQC6_METZD|nr:metalloregulator ArsR/SmtB family transcription factor [Methanosalsum zhilinae]AEH61592.1 transcriptional regulator, ArsR family [Methanosalsum zhilinae DSM 4017]
MDTMQDRQIKGISSDYQIDNRTLAEVESALSEDMSKIAAIFKLLSDPVRLNIIKALDIQELCVCVLVGITDYKYSALSYHLKLLKDAGLIDSKREKSFQIYYLTEMGQSVIKSIKEDYREL